MKGKRLILRLDQNQEKIYILEIKIELVIIRPLKNHFISPILRGLLLIQRLDL
jgi:hypothetical protein